MADRTSYLTEAEVASIQHLHTRAPYAITSISRGMFSIARHYGGMTYQGCHYTYLPEHDECVRVDVLATIKRARRVKPAKAPQPIQAGLLPDESTTQGSDK